MHTTYEATREVSADNSPLVSVIIPIYNSAEFINEAVRSVLAQSFTSYEIIIINDGSIDTFALESILEPYYELIIYLKQQNRGAASARNLGLYKARGRFVAFLDADDSWLPNYLDEQLSFIQNNGCDAVYSDALLIGDSSLAGRTFMETAPSIGSVTIENLLTFKCHIITSGFVSYRRIILAAGSFNEEIYRGHDFDLWIRLLKQGAQIAYNSKVLLLHRKHSKSLSGNSISECERALKVLNKIKCYRELSQSEQASLTIGIAEMEARQSLEIGKTQLLCGQFEAATKSILEANVFFRSQKLSAVLFLLRSVPRLLQRIYKLNVDAFHLI